MRAMLRNGTGVLLVLAIMLLGSVGLWIGTPLLWLWVGSQVQGETGSIGLALLVMFAGAVAHVMIVARLLTRLSDAHRANRIARDGLDPGNATLENVLMASAGVAVVIFAIWFFLFAGASPVPIGIGL